MTTTDRLIGEAEAARRLGMTPGTLRIWRQRKQGPGIVKLGRSVRYDVAELDRYIEKRRVTFSCN